MSYNNLSSNNLSAYIYKDLQAINKFQSVQKIDGGNPFVFLLVGPPCVGKSLIQRRLFDLMGPEVICHLKSSCCLKNRSSRYDNRIGECSASAYDLSLLSDAFSEIINEKTVSLYEYDHQLGALGETSLPLSPNKIIYLDGIAWTYLLSIVQPDYFAAIVPQQVDSWRSAYCFRNTHFRNYNTLLANEMWDLLFDSWLTYVNQILNRRVRPDLIINVDFFGADHKPYYDIIRTTDPCLCRF